MSFFKSLIKELVDEGNTVDIATNEKRREVDDCYRGWGCKIYPITTSRSPFCADNIKAVKQIRQIAEDYDIVHCHTPVAGACARLTCKDLRKNGLRVFYTAHGFHFYKGAPLKNWLIYYPVEKYCSRFTDTLITINHEDYELAKKKMKARRVEYVPGVGIDVDKFKNAVVDRDAKRTELGIPKDAFLLLSVGELNKNKNHQIVIRALAKLNKENVHYMIAGEGDQKEPLLNLAKELGVETQVHLLGYRNDLPELYKTADVNVFPTVREGLGLAAIEGMAAGLPLICADNRGTREYAFNDVNAIVCNAVEDYSNAVHMLLDLPDKLEVLRKNSINLAKSFSVLQSNGIIKELYSNV